MTLRFRLYKAGSWDITHDGAKVGEIYLAFDRWFVIDTTENQRTWIGDARYLREAKEIAKTHWEGGAA